jgi:hypothetical protein
MNEILEALTRIQHDVQWALVELQQTDLFIAIASAAGAILLLQLLLTVWTIRRLGELARMRERMSRLYDSLALLTDTTEAGLAAMAQELSKAAPKRAAAARTAARPATRSTVARRVVDAARRGQPVAEIARGESISEGEVHLHLTLAGAAQPSSPEAAA